jgi:outer membrane protein assembly factor BamA
VFPGLVAQGDGRDSLTLTGGVRYDTRDSQHQPYTGWRVGAIADAALLQTGGAVGATVAVYGDLAFRVPPLLHRGGEGLEENPPTDTFAVGGFAVTTVGRLPFYDRPSLGGGQTLRGYIANRFTGDAAWDAVAEYRFWVIPRGFRLTERIRIERVGLALFGEAGTVASGLEDLPAAAVHLSYGIGVRVSLERTAVFRADVGFSREGPNLSVGFGLPF